ncbi:MAG: hypothetical protein KGZ74_16680 [Chitinophagaceae bacterium]|nr:hypothetical protein [Chitinophagaceae bacterium]
MKKKILFIAMLSALASLSSKANREWGGTASNIQMYENYWVITCANSSSTCFGITDEGDLYVGIIKGPKAGDPVEISPGEWSVPVH